MRTRFGKICSLLLLLSFFTAGISPACHFVSGKILMEICKADGSIETVEMPVEERQQRHAKAQTDCAFCFSSANLKPFISAGDKALSLKGSHYIKLSGGVYVPSGLTLKSYNAQGPPVSVV